MSLLGKIAALHGDVRVPLHTVSEVAEETDPWVHLRGIRSPGKVLPALIAYGTRRHRGERDFAAIQGTGPAVRVDLTARDTVQATARNGPGPSLEPRAHHRRGPPGQSDDLTVA